MFEVSWSKVKVHSRADLKEPTLTLLWQHIDSMPVHHLAWQKQEVSISYHITASDFMEINHLNPKDVAGGWG